MGKIETDVVGLRGQAEAIVADIGRRVESLGERGLAINTYYNELIGLGFDSRAVRSGIGDGMSYFNVTTTKEEEDIGLLIKA